MHRLKKVRCWAPRSRFSGETCASVRHEKPGSVTLGRTEHPKMGLPLGQGEKIGGFCELSVFRLTNHIVRPVVRVYTQDQTITKMENKALVCSYRNAAEGSVKLGKRPQLCELVRSEERRVGKECRWGW